MSEQQIKKYHFLRDEPKKRQFDIYDLAEYQKMYFEDASKPHTHSFYQIIWFRNNSGKHFIDFESYEIKENRLFFVAKNQVHYFEKRSDYRGYQIQLARTSGTPALSTLIICSFFCKKSRKN